MVRALEAAGIKVEASDIAGTPPVDFLSQGPYGDNDAIITNPPYALARQFIERGLRLMSVNNGLVATLLRTDFDHAATRRHLFSECRAFARKLVLTRRIVWFDGPGAAPS